MSRLNCAVLLEMAASMDARSVSVVACARRCCNILKSSLYFNSNLILRSRYPAYCSRSSSVSCFWRARASRSALSSALAFSWPRPDVSFSNSLRRFSMMARTSRTERAFVNCMESSSLNASMTVRFVSAASASFNLRKFSFCSLVRLSTPISRILSRWFFK